MKLLREIWISLGTTNRISGFVLLVTASIIFWESRKWPMGAFESPGPAFMPVVLSILIGGLGIFIFLSGAKSPRVRALDWRDVKHASSVLGVCIFAAMGLERLGYVITTTLILLFILGVIEREKMIVLILVSFGFSIGSYLLFSNVLQVPLPKGPLGF